MLDYLMGNTGKNIFQGSKLVNRAIFLLAVMVLFSTMVSAQVEFRDNNPFQFYNTITVNQGDLNVENGSINMFQNRILGLPAPQSSGEPLTLGAVGSQVVDRSGDSMEGDLDMQNNTIVSDNSSLDLSEDCIGDQC